MKEKTVRVMKEKRIAVLTAALFICLLSLPAGAQQTHTVSGYVMDSGSSETLVNATVLDLKSGLGTVTNEYGFYSLTLPTGNVELVTRYVGYRTRTDAFRLTADTTITLTLSSMEELDEVEIIGNRLDLGTTGSQISAIDIPIEQIKAVPTMFGETDVLKALQLLPGVQAGTEGTAGLFVRGGAPDENLLLIDGVPVYNVNHMCGLFSVFNPDAIKNVTLYKGSFPAHYSGRLSSIVDVRMKDGDMYGYHGNFSIGAVSSKLNFEGPLWKGKTSFNISARRTYSDVITNAVMLYIMSTEGSDSDKLKGSIGYYFDDLNVKVNHKFNDQDRLYLSLYTGADDIYFSLKERESKEFSTTDKFKWKWGNLVAAARWNHVIGQKMFMDVSANYTQYKHDMGLTILEEEFEEKSTFTMGLDMNSGIFDETLRADFHWNPTPLHEVRFGTSGTHHLFKPDIMAFDMEAKQEHALGKVEMLDTLHMKYGSASTDAFESQTYIEDNMTLWDVLKVNLGVSASLFNVDGRTYFSPEPRMSGRVMLSDDWSVKAGYAYMTQYVHLLSNNSLSLPTDLWVPVTGKIAPEHSHQWALGTFYTLDGICDFSLEGYYKTQTNLLEYKEGVTFLTGNTDWQEKVAMGRGWSYGIEFMAQRSVGKLNGWLSYTWSRTQRQFDRPGMVLNGGRPYNAKYDRRHEVDITANYKFSDRFDLSATWLYATGNCGTLYKQYYEPALQPIEQYYYGLTDILALGYAEGRNNFRMPPYHRLDVSANFHKQWQHGITRTWNISAYNAYNQMNPFLVYTYTGYRYQGDDMEAVRSLRKFTLFPIIPSISFSLSW